jgi:hypothetical protein
MNISEYALEIKVKKILIGPNEPTLLIATT